MRVKIAAFSVLFMIFAASCGDVKVTTANIGGSGVQQYGAYAADVWSWAGNTPVISDANGIEICVLKSVSAARRDVTAANGARDFEPNGVYFAHDAFEILPLVCAVNSSGAVGECLNDWNALGARGWRNNDHLVTKYVIRSSSRLTEPGYIFVASFGDYDRLFTSLSGAMSDMLGRGDLARAIENAARKHYNASCVAHAPAPVSGGGPQSPPPPPSGAPVSPAPPPSGGPVNPDA